jgi:hypothetical protein
MPFRIGPLELGFIFLLLLIAIALLVIVSRSKKTYPKSQSHSGSNQHLGIKDEAKEDSVVKTVNTDLNNRVNLETSSVIICRHCGKENTGDGHYCTYCGSILTRPSAESMPTRLKPYIGKDRFLKAKVEVHTPASENTSGQGKLAVVPREVAGWNWGAFLLSFIWSIGNNVWIGLLSLIPYAGIIMFIVLGVKGNEWAWQNKRWDSIEHFKRTQRKWRNWGLALLAIGLSIWFLIAILEGCQVKEPTSQPDIPAYTANQVIAVAQANSPQIPSNYPQCKQLSWSAEYLGQGVWIVRKNCIDSRGLNRGQLEGWYFHEKNGQLNKSSVP